MTRTAKAQPDADSPPAAPSFADVARRVRIITSNLLATALVLIIGLVIGREVIGWWREDENNKRQSAVASQPSEPTPTIAQFGVNGPPLELRTLMGDRTQALAGLRAMCRSAIDSTPPITAKSITDEERRLLNTVAKSTPSETTPQGAIYELPGAIPVVVAVTGHDEATRRVAYCGLALSPAQDGWSLYGIRWLNRGEQFQNEAFPLPPGTQRVMSLATGATATTLVFSGVGEVANWQAFYERTAEERGWRTLHDWRRVGYDWQASYEANTTSSTITRYDIQLSSDSFGFWRGLVTSTAHPAPQAE